MTLCMLVIKQAFQRNHEIVLQVLVRRGLEVVPPVLVKRSLQIVPRVLRARTGYSSHNLALPDVHTCSGSSRPSDHRSQFIPSWSHRFPTVWTTFCACVLSIRRTSVQLTSPFILRCLIGQTGEQNARAVNSQDKCAARVIFHFVLPC